MGTTMYSCKLCGIQAMTLADAESHIFEEEHKGLREEKSKDDTKHLSREEAEEALFLNQNKEIKDEIINGRKMYSCEKCRAMKLPLPVIQKHVNSLVHKKNFRDTEDAAMLEQECKEMKKKGRVTTTYFCTPCGFTSDSIISTKHHLVESDHKKRTVNYCHACKTFSANRGKHQEHRFSIAHKRTMTELDQPYKDPKKEEKDKAKEEARKERKRRESGENKEDEAPKEPEDPLKCKYCDFQAADEDEIKEHKATEAHRRKQYLATGKMPAGGEEEALLNDKPWTSLEHMGLLHRAKEMSEKSARSRSMALDEEVKKGKKDIVELLYKNGVFEKMDENSLKCTTCSVRLQGGAGKKLTAQLFVHFIGDKHIQRLRVAVKGEEQGIREEEDDIVATVPDVEDAVEPSAEDESMVLPDPITVSVHQFMTDEEGELMLEAMAKPADDPEDESMEMQKARASLKGVNSPAPLLHSCTKCRTGLMTAKFMMRHLDTPAHRDKLAPAVWRTKLDLSWVYEHGGILFRCLLCDAGYFNVEQLRLHLSTVSHSDVEDECTDKADRMTQNTPTDTPRCDTCDRYFGTEHDTKTHMLTKLHSIRTDQLHDLTIKPFKDNDDLEVHLSGLQEPKLPILPARLESQKGRIAAIFETEHFVVVQFRLGDTNVRALFDRSRVRETSKETRPVVGYPVTFHACKIDPNVPGVGRYIQYWATQVVLGDNTRTEVLGMEQTYSQLRRDGAFMIDLGLEDAKAELKMQVELQALNLPAVLFDTKKEYRERKAGTVVMASESYLVIKMEGGDMGIQILHKGTTITQQPRDTAEIDSSIRMGDTVTVNAILMDTSRVAPYLCTAVWRKSVQPAVKREKLNQEAIDMYHTLVLAVPTVLPGEEAMDEDLADDDDLAEDDDLAADDDLADDDDLAADDDLEADEDSPSVAKVKIGFGLKISKFSGK